MPMRKIVCISWKCKWWLCRILLSNQKISDWDCHFQKLFLYLKDKTSGLLHHHCRAKRDFVLLQYRYFRVLNFTQMCVIIILGNFLYSLIKVTYLNFLSRKANCDDSKMSYHSWHKQHMFPKASSLIHIKLLKSFTCFIPDKLLWNGCHSLIFISNMTLITDVYRQALIIVLLFHYNHTKTSRRTECEGYSNLFFIICG